MQETPWDCLANTFDVHMDTAKIDPYAADNILIAWPAILRGVKLKQATGDRLNALDYGCGTGGFCCELYRHGYKVAGCDPSSAMIGRAKKATSNIPFYVMGEHFSLNSLNEKPFDLVTSVMVMQFINPKLIQKTLLEIDKVIKPDGILSLTVFNPDFVKRNSGDNKMFQDNHMYIGDKKVPVFIRNENEYDEFMKSMKYTKIHSEKPEFTNEFLTAYEQWKNMDTSEPEFMTLSYQKNLHCSSL